MSTDSQTSSPPPVSDPAEPGPLAAFKRGPLASEPRKPASETPGGQSADKPPEARPPRPDAPAKSPRDKNREEDAEVDRAARSEKKARREEGPRPAVPVPNRRQVSDELEAEVAAALGGLSLDQMVAGEAKTSGERLENESRHRAQIAEIHADDVFFTLGGKNQGVASLRSFAEPPQVGDVIEVVVTGLNPEDNLYDLAIPGASIVASQWTDVAEGSLVEARITGANTGGLECQVGGARGFIPGGQVSLFRIENLGELIGQKMVCVVTESNERRGNLILSRRAVLEREKEESKTALLKELEPGQMREGIVRKLLDFGAFVDLGGVDGLIHISQLSWDRVAHPSEILQEGQKVRVRIEKIDLESGKIGLSLKNPEEHPWTGIEQKFPVGSLVTGPVSRIAQFGAFVKLAPGVEGLIHISELAHHKVFRVENVVKEGEQVECKVLSVDAEAQRIGLSLKSTLAKPVKEGTKPQEEEPADEPPRELAIPKRSGPLRGGMAKKSEGEQFGLKW
ncbi:MAG: S1 RNA-binding domain-containing protein [Pirellulaceae bacterium]